MESVKVEAPIDFLASFNCKGSLSIYLTKPGREFSELGKYVVIEVIGGSVKRETRNQARFQSIAEARKYFLSVVRERLELLE